MPMIKDPGLEDMLSDPMIRMVMSSDRIAMDDARVLLVEAAQRIGHRPHSWRTVPLDSPVRTVAEPTERPVRSNG